MPPPNPHWRSAPTAVPNRAKQMADLRGYFPDCDEEVLQRVELDVWAQAASERDYNSSLMVAYQKAKTVKDQSGLVSVVAAQPPPVVPLSVVSNQPPPPLQQPQPPQYVQQFHQHQQQQQQQLHMQQQQLLQQQQQQYMMQQQYEQQMLRKESQLQQPQPQPQPPQQQPQPQQPQQQQPQQPAQQPLAPQMTETDKQRKLQFIVSQVPFINELVQLATAAGGGTVPKMILQLKAFVDRPLEQLLATEPQTVDTVLTLVNQVKPAIQKFKAAAAAAAAGAAGAPAALPVATGAGALPPQPAYRASANVALPTAQVPTNAPSITTAHTFTSGAGSAQFVMQPSTGIVPQTTIMAPKVQSFTAAAAAHVPVRPQAQAPAQPQAVPQPAKPQAQVPVPLVQPQAKPPTQPPVQPQQPSFKMPLATTATTTVLPARVQAFSAVPQPPVATMPVLPLASLKVPAPPVAVSRVVDSPASVLSAASVEVAPETQAPLTADSAGAAPPPPPSTLTIDEQLVARRPPLRTAARQELQAALTQRGVDVHVLGAALADVDSRADVQLPVATTVPPPACTSSVFWWSKNASAALLQAAAGESKKRARDAAPEAADAANKARARALPPALAETLAQLRTAGLTIEANGLSQHIVVESDEPRATKRGFCICLTPTLTKSQMTLPQLKVDLDVRSVGGIDRYAHALSLGAAEAPIPALQRALQKLCHRAIQRDLCDVATIVREWLRILLAEPD